MVELTESSRVTNVILSCLGVARQHHDGIIATVTNMTDLGNDKCLLTGKFNTVNKLVVDLRMFKILLPYLTTTHVTQVDFDDMTDADVKVTRDILPNIVCDKFVINDSCNLTLTTDVVASVFVNIDTVANVVIERCPNVNIEELRNLYPAITFTLG